MRPVRDLNDTCEGMKSVRHDPLTDWPEAFERYATDVLKRYGAPGMAVAVARDGRTIYEAGLGWRDRERELPATPDTIFGIGSVTKSFTCMAIMQLVDEGRLSVDDPVIRYLPEFSVPNEQYRQAITIHHFMTHTSGLPPLPSLTYALARSLDADPAAAALRAGQASPHPPIDTPEQLLDFIAHHDFELLGPPGAYFSYSNEAFALLGTIIERVTGQRYEDFVTQRILEPLGMTRTTFDSAALAAMEPVTTLYAQKPGEDEVFAAPVWWDAPAMTAAGFLRSTVQDLLKYMEVYRLNGTVNGERILSPESAARMMRPYVRFMPGQYYGYGLMVGPNYRGLTLVEHGGNIKGVAAWVAVVPEAGVTAAVLANMTGVPALDLILSAMNGPLGLPLETRRVQFPQWQPLPGQVEPLLGTYRSGEGTQVTFGRDDQGLYALMDGRRFPARLAAPRLAVVQVKDSQESMEFLVEDGIATAVSYHLRILHRVEEGVEE